MKIHPRSSNRQTNEKLSDRQGGIKSRGHGNKNKSPPSSLRRRHDCV
jgi:hypothetical protein